MPRWLKGRGNPELVGIFYRQMAVLLGAGVPLNDALVSLADQEDPEFTDIIHRLNHRVCTGYNLSQAMAIEDHYFTPVGVGLVSVAERSGSLVAVFDKLADLYARSLRLRRLLVTAMIYPSVQALAILSVAILFVTVIAPGDSGLFTALGGELPWPSKVLIAISDYLRNPWLVGGTLLILGSAVVSFLRAYHSNERMRTWIDDLLLSVPVLGPLLTKVATIRVVYTLESTITVGLPLLTAIHLSEGVVNNLAVRVRLAAVRLAVSEGDSVSEALRNKDLFGPIVAAMIEVGEESGQLDQMLRLIAVQLDDDVERALHALTVLLEPLLLSIAGVAAGFVALAALMPLLQLINNL